MEPHTRIAHAGDVSLYGPPVASSYLEAKLFHLDVRYLRTPARAVVLGSRAMWELFQEYLTRGLQLTTRLETADGKILEFMESPGTHFWAVQVMRVALEKDLVDAVNHMQAMFQLLEERMNAQFEAEGLETVEAVPGGAQAWEC